MSPKEFWSARQTYRYFCSEKILLPVNKCQNGGIKTVWQLPTYAYVKRLLQNPFYAGAYVYGRQSTQKFLENGKIVKRVVLVKAEECKVFIPNHHEGYIDWETFKENEKMISANDFKTGNGVRKGHALLARILRCGHCGRKLRVHYSGKAHHSYFCPGNTDQGGKRCLTFGGGKIDGRISQEVLKAISPLGVQASLAAIKKFNSATNEKHNVLKKQLEQVEYEAMRAFEQYDQVDPRNRLVAAQLEKRWNSKLEEVEKIKSQLLQLDQEIECLGQKDQQKILQLGENFEKVWQTLDSSETKKKIIRTIIEEVRVNFDEAKENLLFVIHWKGGCHTEFQMPKPLSAAGQKTSLENVEIVRQMAGGGYGDDEIARVLNKLGRRTGKGNPFTQYRVKRTRYKHSIAGQWRSKVSPEIFSLGKAASYCNVSVNTIKKLVATGVLKMTQVVTYAPWEIKRLDLDSQPIQKIINHLHKTGKLIIEGDYLQTQDTIFK